MDFKRLASATLITVCLVTPRWVIASEKTDVVAAVHRFFDNLSNNTIETAAAVCDSPVSIIDEFPPHEWHGPTACVDWWKAYNAYNQNNGIKSEGASLGTPWNVYVTGDRAYFVAPSTYTYEQNGKTVKESRSVFTASLKRTESGWRITAWAWSTR
jgi:SnoaL-like domain